MATQGVSVTPVLTIYTTTMERELNLWCETRSSFSAYRVVVASETPMNEPCGTYTLSGCLSHDET